MSETVPDSELREDLAAAQKTIKVLKSRVRDLQSARSNLVLDAQLRRANERRELVETQLKEAEQARSELERFSEELQRAVEERTEELRERASMLQREIAVRKEFEERLAAEQAKLRVLANTDALTGLYSRRLLFELGNGALERARRHRRELSVLVIDLDWFKRVNDDFGHLAGDDVLKHVSELLRQTIRRGDYAFRYGGEEFVAILSETDLPGARIASERIRMAVADAPINVHGDREVHVTCSVGGTTLRQDDTSLEVMLARADDALYQAKAAGRNRVVFATSGDK